MDYLSVEDAAEVMGLSEVEIIRLVKSGQLRNHGTRHITRISKSAARSYAKTHSDHNGMSDNENGGNEDDKRIEPGDTETGIDESDDTDDTGDTDEADDDTGDSIDASASTRYATGADSASRIREGDASRDSRHERLPRKADGDTNLATLAESVRQLTALMGGLQSDVASLKPEEFAPDDDDLRKGAEETATALMKPDSGVSIGSLGRKDGKGKASEKLIDAVFNTPADKLDEMTSIDSDLAVAAYAGVRTFNQFVEGAFVRKPGDRPVFVSDMYLNNVFKLSRSMGSKYLMMALAMSQIERESEDARDKNIIFGGGNSEDY